MRRLIISLIALVACSLPAQARELPQPQLMAVYAYADWCPNCKALSPVIDRVRAELAGKPVVFVTLDLTDKPKIMNSILLAQALGIGDWLKAQGSATGYVGLLDAKSKKEITRFDRTQTSQQIVETITTNLKP